jgi:glycine cleavage system H protein
MSETPSDRRYSIDHIWLQPVGAELVVGITEFAQDQLGDVVYVELPRVGDQLEAGKTFGVIESVKTASDLYAPLTAEVVEVNATLVDEPGQVNDQPYTSGWLLKVRAADGAAVLEGLLTAEQYVAQTGE